MHLKSFLLGSVSLLQGIHAQASLPNLTLPWGTYQAQLSPDPKIYLFKDVRFGANPVRFGPSSFPGWLDDSLQSFSADTQCVQVNTTALSKSPGGRDRLGDPNQDEPHVTSSVIGSEDCLFLDVYVPVSAFESDQQLPVIVWFYGGAYAFGSKDQGAGVLPFYSGRAIIKASGYKTIFVTGNYRLGAFGWLAGSYMEKAGLPNAGLYDQALLLKWVQKYISKVKGDKDQVTAWGESAGAGSILHHVIREDGTVDPLFKTFAVQSPAFEWQWDNSKGGQLDAVYKSFSNYSHCGEKYDIDCLRAANLSDLANANQAIFSTILTTGLFPMGPSVDGKWITNIPTILFSQGKYWPKIKSAIVSHVGNEAEHFTPPSVDNEKTFDAFLAKFLPGAKLKPVRADIKEHYNCKTEFDGNWNLCLRTIIRDASFTCNTRDLITAYSEQAYAMSYGYPNDDLAYHSSDLVPLYANSDMQILIMLQIAGLKFFQALRWTLELGGLIQPDYLDYFSSFALTGDVNSGAAPGWPVVNTTGKLFSNVMNPQVDGWKLISDDQNSEPACAFWTHIAEKIVDTPKSPVDVASLSDTDSEGVQEEL